MVKDAVFDSEVEFRLVGMGRHEMWVRHAGREPKYYGAFVGVAGGYKVEGDSEDRIYNSWAGTVERVLELYRVNH